MPASNKVELTLEIESDQASYLERIAERFDFPDSSKALRVLLDFAIQDVDPDTIFSQDNMRCRHCV